MSLRGGNLGAPVEQPQSSYILYKGIILLKTRMIPVVIRASSLSSSECHDPPLSEEACFFLVSFLSRLRTDSPSEWPKLAFATCPMNWQHCKGRIPLPNQMNFWKSAKGGFIFNPKIYIADFGTFKQGFLSIELIQKNDFGVQGMFFQQFD